MIFKLQGFFNITVMLLISSGMAYNQAPCDSSLIAFYDFEGNYYDRSGNAFHGFPVGNVKVTDRLEIIDDVSTVFLPTHMLQPTQDFSISCRVKFSHFQIDGAAPINVIINGYSDNNAFVLGYRKLANIVHLTFDGIGTDVPLPFELLEDQWYCLVFAREGEFGSVYVDGRQAGGPMQMGPNPTSLDVLLLGQDQDCFAGCFSSNQSLNGQLDNLRIYGRSLSADDAAALCATEIEEAIICEGETLQGYEETGTYISYLYPTNGGCETMHLLRLTILPAKDTFISVTLCPGENYKGIAAPGIYPFEFITEDGCDSIVMTEIEMSNPPYFPTAFSPDGDGINDHFFAFGKVGDFDLAYFQVFDRWGGLCYSSERQMKANDLEYAWDGNFGDFPCALGIYTWIAKVRMKCGLEQWWAGEVSLIR